jgi:hypothetical protein
MRIAKFTEEALSEDLSALDSYGARRHRRNTPPFEPLHGCAGFGDGLPKRSLWSKGTKYLEKISRTELTSCICNAVVDTAGMSRTGLELKESWFRKLSHDDKKRWPPQLDATKAVDATP